MKKWFMLALLPLLLLAQQEAGAIPLAPTLAPETLVSAVPGFYTATFLNEDRRPGDGVYDYTDITVLFDPSIDLDVAYRSINAPSIPIPSSDVQTNTLMSVSTLSITTPILPLLTLLELVPTPLYITIVPPNVSGRQLNTSTHTMTAFYNAGDAGSDPAAIPAPGEPACIVLGAGPSLVERCATILPPVSVPAPTSLMLLGIGLLALSIPYHRGKLSQYPALNAKDKVGSLPSRPLYSSFAVAL